MVSKKNKVISQLTPKAKDQLVLDCEKYPGLKFQSIVSKRPLLYGGEYQGAARNRFNYLRSVQAKGDRVAWLKLKDKVSIGGDEKKDDVDTTLSEQLQSLNISKGTPKAKQARSFYSPSVKPEPVASFNSPAYSIKSPAFKSPQGKSATMRLIPGHQMFDDIAAAIDFADDVVEVDFDYPERNNQGVLCFRTDGVKVVRQVDETKSKKELISKFRMLVPDIIDLRDLKKHQGMIVCKGRAFLFVRPCVPHYSVYNFKQLFEVEEIPCNETKDNVAAHMVKIDKDESRNYRTVLFVFPDDISLCNDFSSVVPSVDMKLKTRLRIVQGKYNIGKKDAKDIKTAEQTFFPVYYEARILIGERRDDLDFDEDSDSDVESAMKGQKLSAPDTATSASGV